MVEEEAEEERDMLQLSAPLWRHGELKGLSELETGKELVLSKYSLFFFLTLNWPC